MVVCRKEFCPASGKRAVGDCPAAQAADSVTVSCLRLLPVFTDSVSKNSTEIRLRVWWHKWMEKGRLTWKKFLLPGSQFRAMGRIPWTLQKPAEMPTAVKRGLL